MKSTYFKYLFGLITILGLLLSSCTNSTEPVSDNTDQLQKVEYAPTVDEAQKQAEGLLLESIKPLVEGSAVGNVSGSLGKNAGNVAYYFVDGWHTWRGEMDASPFDIEDSYNTEFLGKIQFQDGTYTVQALPEGAEYMLMYLNAHAAFGFVGNDPSGDEVWYDFEGMVKSLDGNPSTVNAAGEYERRWVGLYSADGENWAMTEIHNTYKITINHVLFYYDWVNNDYKLDGMVSIVTNGIRILARFDNSRTAYMEIYQGGTLIGTRLFELPNFYQNMNIPSLNDFIFGAGFAFPFMIPF